MGPTNDALNLWNSDLNKTFLFRIYFGHFATEVQR